MQKIKDVEFFSDIFDFRHFWLSAFLIFCIFNRCRKFISEYFLKVGKRKAKERTFSVFFRGNDFSKVKYFNLMIEQRHPSARRKRTSNWSETLLPWFASSLRFLSFWPSSETSRRCRASGITALCVSGDCAIPATWSTPIWWFRSSSEVPLLCYSTIRWADQMGFLNGWSKWRTWAEKYS